MTQEPINILLVDDEPRNLDVLVSMLEQPSYRLLRAGDADTALRTLLQCDVAAIILDMKMPGVSGLQLAQLIKGTKKFRQIPILFLTAYMVEDADALTGYGAGAVDYLTKPVNPAILRHKVAVFADLFQKTRALAELNETLEARVRERTAELARSEAALRETNEQKDRFIATLAHELRNPLASLRTGLDLLVRITERTQRSDRTLGMMNRQLDSLVRLIDDLLDVSRISRATLELRQEHVALRTVIDQAIETVAPLLERHYQTVNVEARDAIDAYVDPTRIGQVVGNLVSNASKHSRDGASIRVVLRREGDAAVIDVIDEGAGIKPDQLERVFEMFTKIERSTQFANDGLGIGLALSRRLAQLHGGTLKAASEGEGRGATFTLTIPVGPASTRPVNGAQHAGASYADPNATARQPLNIVVVEDNEEAADLMSMWLMDLGHIVHVAHTGVAGLALIKQLRPDVVLCDIGLPGLNGIQVCERVVKEVAGPPVMIAVTGWGTESDRNKTTHAGFRHHLVKPVELKGLLKVLDAVAPAS
jgi:signal transduction histidine kinase